MLVTSPGLQACRGSYLIGARDPCRFLPRIASPSGDIEGIKVTHADMMGLDCGCRLIKTRH
jgi:hypothetical protein